MAEPAWRARVEAVRALVRDHGDEAMVGQIDAIEAALTAAEHDHRQLATAVERLDPERSAGELKQALRARRTASSPAPAADDALVASLQQRYRTINELQNRQEELRSRIDLTVADLERLAARHVEVTLLRRTDEWTVDEELARLHDDLTALERAHDELRGL